MYFVAVDFHILAYTNTPFNHPMGKNFGSRYATVAFFSRSVPIFTPTGVNKRQFYDIAVRLCYTTVVKLSCLRLSGNNWYQYQYRLPTHYRTWLLWDTDIGTRQ